MNEKISSPDYDYQYDPQTATFTWEGVVRLGQVEDYKPIGTLLQEALSKNPSNLTLDLRKLKFLNSSGINFLALFTIKVRERSNFTFRVYGSNNIPWQGKSLKNLEKIMPTVELEWK